MLKRRYLRFLLAFSIMISIISYKNIYIRDRSWSPPVISFAIEAESVNSGDQQQNNSWKRNHRISQAQEPMVLSLDYWAHSGNALENLFSLQCWANSVNITKMVEPSISTVFYFHDKQDHPNLRFQDLFDINHWNQISLILNRSILVSRNNFLNHASKKVIYVQLRYTRHSSFRCKFLADLAKQDWFELLESNGFKISTVCIDVLESIATDVFKNKIYGSSRASVHNVTILFETWRGLSTKKDGLLLAGSKCEKGDLSHNLISTRPAKIKYPPLSLSPFAPLVPSKRVLMYFVAFVSQYMHGMPYVAVMFRSEKLKQSIISSSPQHSFCMEEIMSDHKKALEHVHINGTKTLLFSNSGSYGSRSLLRDNTTLQREVATAKKFSQYLHKNLELKLSIEQFNSAFEEITHSKDSMLMSSLVRVVVAKAACVVMVGGGSFQKLTLSMYAHHHKGHECYFFRNSECIPMYLNP